MGDPQEAIPGEAVPINYQTGGGLPSDSMLPRMPIFTAQLTSSNLTLQGPSLPDSTLSGQGKRPRVGKEDLHQRMEVKGAVEAPASGTGSANRKKIICFGQGDPANPYNWSKVL